MRCTLFLIISLLSACTHPQPPATQPTPLANIQTRLMFLDDNFLDDFDFVDRSVLSYTQPASHSKYFFLFDDWQFDSLLRSRTDTRTITLTSPPQPAAPGQTLDFPFDISDLAQLTKPARAPATSTQPALPRPNYGTLHLQLSIAPASENRYTLHITSLHQKLPDPNVILTPQPLSIPPDLTFPLSTQFNPTQTPTLGFTIRLPNKQDRTLLLFIRLIPIKSP